MCWPNNGRKKKSREVINLSFRELNQQIDKHHEKEEPNPSVNPSKHNDHKKPVSQKN